MVTLMNTPLLKMKVGQVQGKIDLRMQAAVSFGRWCKDLVLWTDGLTGTMVTRWGWGVLEYSQGWGE
jgi:hypothetical protein